MAIQKMKLRIFPKTIPTIQTNERSKQTRKLPFGFLLHGTKLSKNLLEARPDLSISVPAPLH